MLTKLAATLAAIVILLGVLEVAARTYIRAFASEAAFKKYASLQQLEEKYQPKVIPHRYLGFYPTPFYDNGGNKHNSLGFRGDEIVQPKPAGEFRIACLGGSTTYTLGVDDYRVSYPDLLEEELVQRGFDRVTVVNAGVPGYSSWETLINFEFRVLDLDPDLIVVYHGVNDIHPRLVWPPSAYRGDNSGRSSALATFREPSIADFSALARILMIRSNRMAPPNAFANSIDVYPDTYYAEEFVIQKKERSYPQGIFQEVSALDMLATNKPVYFRRNIENLVALAEARGIEVVLGTFAFSRQFRGQPRAGSEEYVRAYRETNLVVRSICEETVAHLFDFAAVFPQDREYYTDGRHVTELGSRLKAHLFAEHLASSGLLPAADPLPAADSLDAGDE